MMFGSRHGRVSLGHAAVTALVLAACVSQPREVDVTGAPAGAAATSIAGAQVMSAFAIDQPPGNLTITPDGRRILSLHQFFVPTRVLGEIAREGGVVHYPARGEGEIPVGLGAVLGIRSDTAGVLHILDNGNSGKAPPKLVLWDTRTNRLVRTIDLRAVTDTNSFINDLAFDYRRNHVYISDPAGGPNAAIVVVDMATGRARRVLQGHASTVPEDIEFATEGKVPTRKRPDGTLEPVKIGVDGITIDYQNEFVYFAPLHGRTMYRIRAAMLADAAMSAEQLGAGVERYSAKPPSDGMVMDQAGNIYLGDLPNNAFGVITPAREYRELARRDDLKWVDDFEFGADGMLYIVTTQLHLSPELNAGKREPQPPFRIFRMQPLARGRQGF